MDPRTTQHILCAPPSIGNASVQTSVQFLACMAHHTHARTHTSLRPLFKLDFIHHLGVPLLTQHPSLIHRTLLYLTPQHPLPVFYHATNSLLA